MNRARGEGKKKVGIEVSRLVLKGKTYYPMQKGKGGKASSSL